MATENCNLIFPRNFFCTDETDQNGNTALVSAIRYQNFELAEQLIQDDIDVNIENNYGQTALLYAVTNTSDFDIAKFVPKISVPETVENSCCVESLNFPFQARDNEVIQKLQKSKSYDSDRLSLVKMLLNAGADVNHKDYNGCSPIQCAVYTSDLELVKTLIEAGAVIESQNELGVSALHDAILCCNKEMVHLLLSHGTPSLWPCLDTKTVKGNTPLHWAALFNRYSSHKDIIKLLLKHPVDLNSQNASGQTPFHLITMKASVDLVLDFIWLNANIMLADNTKMSALNYARHNQDKRVYDLVIGMVAINKIVQKFDGRGRTALHIASQLNQWECVRHFINRGADVNAKDTITGETPLSLCIFHPLPRLSSTKSSRDERNQTINLLLQRGGDVNAKFCDMKGNETTTTIIDKAIRENKLSENFDISFLIIELVAINEARTNKPAFDDYNLAVLNENPTHKNYYDKCRAEVKAMKNHKIQDMYFVTYFHILTEPVEVVARYVRNKSTAEKLKNSDYPSVYSIFGSYLRKKINAAIDKQQALEKACTILSTTMQFGNPSHPVFEIITSKYMSEAEVKFLIDTAPDKDVIP